MSLNMYYPNMISYKYYLLYGAKKKHTGSDLWVAHWYKKEKLLMEIKGAHGPPHPNATPPPRKIGLIKGLSKNHGAY